MRRRGFTLIELIVVMAIISILVLLGVPKYKSYTEEARITKLTVEAKELEKASQKYYMTYNDWPRLNDEAYSKDEVKLFGEKIYGSTGAVVELEDGGSYYDVDYNKLSNYISIPTNSDNYILQNPVGNVYVLFELNKEKKASVKNQAPTAVINMTPSEEITTLTKISWNYLNSTDTNGDDIVNAEWNGKQDIYSTAGTYTVQLRVQDSRGLWSERVEKTFTVTEATTIPLNYVGQYGAFVKNQPNGSIYTFNPVGFSIPVTVEAVYMRYDNGYGGGGLQSGYAEIYNSKGELLTSYNYTPSNYKWDLNLPADASKLVIYTKAQVYVYATQASGVIKVRN